MIDSTYASKTSKLITYSRTWNQASVRRNHLTYYHSIKLVGIGGQKYGYWSGKPENVKSAEVAEEIPEYGIPCCEDV